MATATTGYTWASGNTVLPGLLNQMVNSATITLSNDEVTTAKIVDAGVTDAKLASGIDASKLTTGTLPADRIGSDAITTARLLNASVTPAKLSQPLTSTAAVATTSGTFVDITGIPAWATRIVLVASGVQTNGSSYLLVQIGSGTPDTSGYSGGSSNRGSGTSATNGWVIFWTGSTTASGTVTLVKTGASTWVSTHLWGQTSVPSFGSGAKTLSGDLDTLRLTTTLGTNSFVAGNISAIYE
jgi:hypothetical protein